MLRFLFVFCILCICAGVSAQEHVIKKSSDLVVIKGKSYYLHTVGTGQTLYSISKAYGVDVEQLKELNGKKDNTLSLYEVLKVPYTDPFVQQDAKYYYHKVKKGETLYSISRLYEVKPRRILKENGQYKENEPLAIGAVVRLPLDEINPLAIKAAVKKEEGGKMPEPAKLVAAAEVKVKPEEKIIPKPESPKPEIKKPETKEVAKKEAEKPLPEVVLVKEDEHPKGMPSFLSDVVMYGDPTAKIALLLPLYASEYPLMIDTLNAGVYKLSARSEQFIYFYEGILLAVDSLKNKGYKIDLHVFDTEKNTQKIEEITDKLDQLAPDLIIGPVYGSEYKAVIDNLQNKNIPVVYPLSARSESFAQYPNFIQVNASFATVSGKMADWIALQSANANIINIELPDATNDEDKKTFARKMKQINNVRSFKWNLSSDPLLGIKSLLLPDRENIIVLPTTREADVSKVLPVLAAYADSYKMTMVGFPEWQTFTSVDHETYFKLNTKLFTYSYVDNNSPAALAFASKFRNYFYTEPNTLAFKAYDMGLYFMGLVAKYRDRSLEAIEYYNKDGLFSRFGFAEIKNNAGKENQALYIVNFGSDYQLKIQALK